MKKLRVIRVFGFTQTLVEFPKLIGKSSIQLVFLITLLHVAEVSAQDNGAGLVAVDKVNYIEFVTNTYRLSPSGKEQLGILGEYLNSHPVNDTTRLIFSPLVDTKEYKKDEFIGFKRCKILVDILVERFNVPSDRILIKSQKCIPDLTRPNVWYAFSVSH